MKNRWFRLTAVIMLALFGLVFFTTSANAQDFLYGTAVPAGETVENDVLLNGDELRVDGTVAGDLFAFGRSVTINGDVTGSAFIVAEDVEITGSVEGSIYVIAMSLKLEEAANIGHSVYFLGLSLQMARDSQIGRDLNGVSLSAILRGTTGRNQNLIIGLFEIARQALNWFNELNTGKSIATTVTIEEQAAIPIRIIPASVAGGGHELPVYSAKVPTQVEAPTTGEVNDWLTRFFQGLVSFLIVGGLAIWLIPRPFERWAGQVQSRPLSSFGWGLVAYIVGFVGVVILALVIIAIGASLGFISLWPLALTWLGIGLSGLGLAFWSFILFVAFMSKAIVAYVIGYWIFSKVYARANGRRLWPLLLGLLIYTLICMIPVLGWAWGFIVTCLGLGAVWQVLRDRRQSGDMGDNGDGDTAVVEEVAASSAA